MSQRSNVKLLVNLKRLVNALQFVNKGVGRNDLGQTLEYVVLEFVESENRDNRIVLRSNDGGGWTIANLIVMQSKKGQEGRRWKIAFDGKVVLNWLSMLNSNYNHNGKGSVSLDIEGAEVSEETGIVTTGFMRLSYGDNLLNVSLVDSTLLRMSIKEDVEYNFVGIMNAKLLRYMQPMFNLARNVKDGNSNLMGLMLGRKEDSLYIYATDGHRMYYRPFEFMSLEGVETGNEEQKAGDNDIDNVIGNEGLLEYINENTSLVWGIKYYELLKSLIDLAYGSKVGVYLGEDLEREDHYYWKFKIGNYEIIRFDGRVLNLAWNRVLGFKESEDFPEVAFEFNKKELEKIIDIMSRAVGHGNSRLILFFDKKYMEDVDERQGEDFPIKIYVDGATNGFLKSELGCGVILMLNGKNKDKLVSDADGIGIILNIDYVRDIMKAMGEGTISFMYSLGEMINDSGVIKDFQDEQLNNRAILTTHKAILVRTLNEKGKGGDLEIVVMPLS